MAEVSQYTFNLKDVAEALVKKQGIHDGLWALSVDFMFAAGLAGPVPSEIRPAAIAQIASVSLVRANDAEGESKGFTVDAAEVNPATK